MEKRTYKVTFITPAFMGNAEQQGQWRTPPFKALLRQWWRVAVAKDHDFNVNQLRESEDRLFGCANDKGARRSQVRIRLESWQLGKLTHWMAKSEKVEHPEVKQQVGTHLYLGYGLKKRNAIQNGESATLQLAWPMETPELDHALDLMHWFGTLGGRSRNAWGSFQLEPEQAQPPQFKQPALQAITRDWKDCLAVDWPHAIGKDDRGLLIWETDLANSWEAVIDQLAKLKIAFRTQFNFTGGNHAKGDRHVLAYPVTKHNPWGSQVRNANQIRFKVVREGGGYKGRIVHLPCALPEPFARDFPRQRQEQVWAKVHEKIDEHLPQGRLK
jgi:CRISPR-associated protein Cmr1